MKKKLTIIFLNLMIFSCVTAQPVPEISNMMEGSSISINIAQLENNDSLYCIKWAKYHDLTTSDLYILKKLEPNKKISRPGNNIFPIYIWKRNR